MDEEEYETVFVISSDDADEEPVAREREQNQASHKLDRFLIAQENNYSRALAEIRSGQKQGHWMWYIFPQIAGLGMSEVSEYYAIANLDEARAYLSHPVLGQRLKEITSALLKLKASDARRVMGHPDDLKLRSSMTLFKRADPSCNLFQKVLDKFFNGEDDKRTIARIA